MTPPNFQSAIDVAFQIIHFFINLFLGIINSIPSLPIEIKGFIIGVIILGFVPGAIRLMAKPQNINDLLEKIKEVLSR